MLRQSISKIQPQNTTKERPQSKNALRNYTTAANQKTQAKINLPQRKIPEPKKEKEPSKHPPQSLPFMIR